MPVHGGSHGASIGCEPVRVGRRLRWRRIRRYQRLVFQYVCAAANVPYIGYKSETGLHERNGLAGGRGPRRYAAGSTVTIRGLCRVPWSCWA